MLAITSQWRRLRHIYSMLAKLEKEGVDLNMTTSNILKDIKKITDKLVEEATIYHG